MERRLLRSAKQGDVQAFEMLTEAYWKKVYNIVLKYCGRDLDVSGLAQEVFVRLFKSIGHVREDELLALTLYRTAMDVCRECRSGSKPARCGVAGCKAEI